jgi:hypothetical protein
MRQNIHPLCQHHLMPMALSQLAAVTLLLGRNVDIRDVYRCTEPDCGSFYNWVHGYFETSNQAGKSPMNKDASSRRCCPNHDGDWALMYIAEAGSPEKSRVWLCSVEGCDGRREEGISLSKM